MILALDDSGSGPAIVLLHGFPLDRTMWTGQRAALTAQHRLITPDLRGHGESPILNGPATMDVMADDVIETLDSLGLREPVVLGGLSMGGYVALSAILRYPERFRALILMDTRATADSEEAANNRRAQAEAVESSRNVTPVAEAMIPKLLAAATLRERTDLVEALRGVILATSPQGVAAALRGMADRPDRSSDLGGIHQPTLVLVGEEDAITPPAEAEELAAAIPSSKLVVIPRAGHMAPLENHEATNEAILAFLPRQG